MIDAKLKPGNCKQTNDEYEIELFVIDSNSGIHLTV